MEYKIICEDCKKPGEIEKKEVNRYITKTTYKNKCDCGGKIKPLID